jgi:hypothetical protein
MSSRKFEDTRAQSAEGPCRRFAKEAEIERIFGLPSRTLQMRRHLGLPPEFYRVGRSILYCIQEVEDFVRQGRAHPLPPTAGFRRRGGEPLAEVQ